MPLSDTPTTIACALPRDPATGAVHVHQLTAEVCCTGEGDGFLRIDEWERVGDAAHFAVPELAGGFHYAACPHSAATVGSRPLVAGDGIPLPEPGGWLPILVCVVLGVVLAYFSQRGPR